MSAPAIFTFSDVVEASQDYLQGQTLAGAASAGAQQVIRHAIRSAYREIVSARDWKCMIRSGRIQLHAPYTTGTIAYDNATRTVTLTGGTWPSWTVDAAIRFDDVVSDVESVSGATLILDATMNPGQDVAAGTTYSLYPRWYCLPAGFVSLAQPMETTLWRFAEEITLSEMFARDRFDSSSGDIRYYAIGPAQDLYGSMALYVHPASDADETIDFAYKTRPRDIRYTGMDAADMAGTIAATSGSAAIVGTSTSFASGHVGSIVRISSSATKPTGIEGANPWVEQRSVAAVTDATHLTLDAAVTANRSGVKYVISDPIDLDVSLYDAFLRCCEKHLAINRASKNAGGAIKIYEEALFAAKCADGRTTQRVIAGARESRPIRLRDYGTLSTLD